MPNQSSTMFVLSHGKLYPIDIKPHSSNEALLMFLTAIGEVLSVPEYNRIASKLFSSASQERQDYLMHLESIDPANVINRGETMSLPRHMISSPSNLFKDSSFEGRVSKCVDILQEWHSANSGDATAAIARILAVSGIDIAKPRTELVKAVEKNCIQTSTQDSVALFLQDVSTVSDADTTKIDYNPFTTYKSRKDPFLPHSADPLYKCYTIYGTERGPGIKWQIYIHTEQNKRLLQDPYNKQIQAEQLYHMMHVIPFGAKTIRMDILDILPMIFNIHILCDKSSVVKLVYLEGVGLDSQIQKVKDKCIGGYVDISVPLDMNVLFAMCRKYSDLPSPVQSQVQDARCTILNATDDASPTQPSIEELSEALIGEGIF